MNYPANPGYNRDYLLGFQSALVHSIARIRRQIGQEVYYVPFWPARHTAKRRRVEDRLELLRVEHAAQSVQLLWVKAALRDCEGNGTEQPQNASQVPGIDPNPTPTRDEGER